MAAVLKESVTCSTAEAARYLGVTPQTVIKLVKAGRLKAVNASTGPDRPRYRVLVDSVQALVAEASR